MLAAKRKLFIGRGDACRLGVEFCETLLWRTQRNQLLGYTIVVPAEFKLRKCLRIYSSLWLNAVECPYASLSLQTLGYAERVLLDMEAKLASLANDYSLKKERDLLLSECSAHLCALDIWPLRSLADHPCWARTSVFSVGNSIQQARDFANAPRRA